MQSVGLRAAARIVVPYVAAASAWIIFSDVALARLGFEPAIARALESAKGLLFVAVTGALLFGLVYREFGRHQSTQHRLADTRRLSQALADALPAVVYTRQPETGAVTYLNRGLERLLGHPQPRPWADLVHPEDAPAWMAAASAPLAAGEVRTHDFRGQHASGEWRWLRSREVRLDPAAGGEAGTVLGVTVDITAPKQTEANLAASELRWRLLVETIPDYVAVYDANGGYEFLNHYAEGYSAQEVIGRHYSVFLPEASRAVYDQALDRIRQTGRPEFVEYMAPGHQGALRHYDSHIVPIHEAGTLAGFLVVARDITERKQQEADLRAALELFRQTFHSNPLASVLTRLPDRRVVDANVAFETLTGYARADVIGRPVSDFDVWADPAERERVTQTLLQTGAVTDYECTLKTRSGALRHGVFFAQRFETGGERYVLTKVMDITQRRATEAALRRSEATLRLFVEFAPAAIAMFDREMNYLAASRRYRTDYDLGEQDLIGRSHYAVFPEMSERWREIHQRCLAGAVERAEEDPFPRADGRLDWVRWEIRPWHDSDGAIGGVLLFSEVITARKQAEQAKREAEERFSKAFYQSPIGIALVDLSDQTIRDVNEALLEWTGLARDQLVGRRVTELNLLMRPDVRAEMLQALEAHGSYRNKEVQARLPNGELRTGLNSGTRIMLAGRPHNLSLFLDITARKRAEEELRASREMFFSAFHVGPAGMTITRIADGAFLDVNQAFLAMFEFSREEVIGHTSLELNMLTPASRRRLIQEQRDAGGLRAAELQARSKSGKLVDILFSSRPLELSGEWCHVTTMIDISDRKRAEDALRQLNAELEQRVAERTAELKAQYEQHAALEERQRLARELHDVVSQSLFSASVIAETLPRLWERDPGLARQALDDLHRLTRGALAEMRALLLELRPEAMHQSALPDLLGHLVNALRGRTELDILLTAEPTLTLPPEVRVALYRIAQEAMNNVVKHARARRVEIRLGQPAAAQGIEMHIHDDGQGFDPTHLDPGRLGLAIMRERAEAIGATLTLNSRPGQGAEVEVTWLAPANTEGARNLTE